MAKFASVIAVILLLGVSFAGCGTPNRLLPCQSSDSPIDMKNMLNYNLTMDIIKAYEQIYRAKTNLQQAQTQDLQNQVEMAIQVLSDEDLLLQKWRQDERSSVRKLAQRFTVTLDRIKEGLVDWQSSRSFKLFNDAYGELMVRSSELVVVLSEDGTYKYGENIKEIHLGETELNAIAEYIAKRFKGEIADYLTKEELKREGKINNFTIDSAVWGILTIKMCIESNKYW